MLGAGTQTVGRGAEQSSSGSCPPGKGRRGLCSSARTAVRAEGEEQQLYTAPPRRRLLWPVGATAKAERGATQALLPSPLYTPTHPS